MRTEQIVYLTEIHKVSSLHKASEVLHISPQALSLSMRTLEDELGFQILERTRTGVVLTQKGNQLLQAGKNFLKHLHKLQQIPEKKYQTILQGSFDLMVTNGVIETILPSAISQLYIDYPQFHLTLRALEFEQIIDTLQTSTNELALIYQLSINGNAVTEIDTAAFHFHDLLAGTYHCMVHKNFPIYHYKSISLKSIAKYPFVIYTPTKALILKLLEYGDCNPKIIYVDNFTLYKQLLKDGAGLAMTLIINESDIPAVEIPNLKPIPIKENILSTLGCLQKKEQTLSPKAEALLLYLSDFYNNFQKQDIF